jgi:cytosine/adenosine deaminase-related metal-dependent hydrolase
MKEKTILLHDADFVVIDAQHCEKSTSVVVQGNRIAAIGKDASLSEKYSFDDRIDCHGQALLPGLINCHTHCHETMMRGLGHDLSFLDWCNNLVFPAALAMETGDEELYYMLAQLTAMEAVASGTTALVEHSVNFAKRHSYTMALAWKDFGIRGAVARGAEDFSAIDYGHVGAREKELKEVEEFLAKWPNQKNDLVQAWVGPSGGKRQVGGCTAELLRELKMLANRFRTHFHIHLAGTIQEIENIQRETNLPGSVTYAQNLGLLDRNTSLAHCIWVMEGEEEILARSGARVVHCPSCNQICALGIQPLVKLLQKGVVCTLGTDGAPQNDSLDMFRDMRQAVLLQRIQAMKANAMTHIQAFQMATKGGAQLLGIDNLGKIDVGYLADLVAVRIKDNIFLTPLFDPLETLVYAGSGGRDVAMTMVNGRILYLNGEFKTVKTDKVIRKIQEEGNKIRKSLKL